MKKFMIPEGTRDLILGECSMKRTLQHNLEKIFDSYGYKEIVTPSIEYFRTYLTGLESIRDEQMYKFLDYRGRIMTMRMDMTVPIARVVATRMKDQPLPLRFRYCANVYKINESFAGKLNEVTDCGVELIGQTSEESDLEVLVCALEAMESMKQESYTLELGDVNFFHGACSDLNLTEEEQGKLANLVDKKSIAQLKEYLDDLRLNEKAKAFFLQLPWMCGDVTTLDEVIPYCFNSRLRKTVENLRKIYMQLKELGYEKNITFDLGKIPHLTYYTGILFEGFIEGSGTSVLSGGRYDTLLEKFGTPMPAIGFSVKLDYVLPVLKQENNDKPTVVMHYPGKLKVEAIKQAADLRKTHKVELIQDEFCNTVEIKGDIL